MQGMINRSLESFLRTTYGDAIWQEILHAARIDQGGFLAMMSADPRDTRKVVRAAARLLGKPLDELLEDLGGWLVRLEPVRRLLRFSGADYIEFVHSLDELPGRARMILPDLPAHGLVVERTGAQTYSIRLEGAPPGWIWALAGALRGMADDYGTLAVIVVSGQSISLSIALEDHAMSRPFDLCQQPEKAAP
ncbi:heme NO-binding protein [Paracoccus limosus]|uniref:Heme NO-binding protein n=1 Tax=Paracoccus limosus TaxID=913252 RepID=A0A844GYS2_9RHOB|nr:heme NO-binding domain-containing protein [Paracoccus limosus]MTH33789.1 heme NO-binding protein [Paracoccus limosus]